MGRLDLPGHGDIIMLATTIGIHTTVPITLGIRVIVGTLLTVMMTTVVITTGVVTMNRTIAVHLDGI